MNVTLPFGNARFAATLFKFVAGCLILLNGSLPAKADELIISSDRAAEAVWSAAVIDSYAQQRPEEITWLQFTVELYRRNPNADPQAVLQYIDHVRTVVRERYQRGDPSPPGQAGTGIASYDAANGAIDVISSFPFAEYTWLPFVLTSLRESKRISDTIYHRRMAPIYSLSSLAKKAAYAEILREDQRRTIQQSAHLAQGNANAATVIRATTGIPFGNAGQVMPTVPALQSLGLLINGRNEIVTSTEQLRGLFETQLENLQNTVSSNMALLHDLSAGQAVLYSYMTNAELRALRQEQIAREQAAYEHQIQAANAAVHILSTLVGFKDPELGRQMEVIGGSTVRVADAIHKFTEAQAGGLGVVILTGNLLGATMNVVSLFSGGGSTSDQQILQAIAQLRQMIHQLRVEMHDRFDRVDAALNQIYETMNNRFDRIDFTQGILVHEVEEIQESLYDLQSDLYRVERRMFGFLDAISRRDLNETINGYLGYRETYGEPIPWPSYQFAENKFYTWAVDNARDEALSGWSSRSYEDAALYEELSQPLENNLNYLAEYISRKFVPFGVPSFTQVRLANPRDWAIAANAWMELAAESPLFFRRIATNRLEQIYRTGLDIHRAATNITIIDGTNGPAANYSLFNALFANYRAKALTFKQALVANETEFRLSISSDPQRRTAFSQLDLWGGTTQVATHGLALDAIPPAQDDTSRGVTNILSPPNNWEMLVPQIWLLADLLEIDNLTVEWGDYEIVDPHPGIVSSLGNGTVGTLQMAIRGRFDDKPLFRRVYRTNLWGIVAPPLNPPYGNREWPVPGTSYSGFPGVPSGTLSTNTWKFLLPPRWLHDPTVVFYQGVEPIAHVFMRDSVDATTGEMLTNRAALANEVDQALRSLQREDYNYVIGSLTQAGSLESAASQLSGAKVLLESMIVLGFPESLENDDFVRALLFGGERLPDADAIKDLCDLGIERSYDTNQNAKVDIAAIVDERVSALETWVSNRLSQIQTNGHAEQLRLVSSTLSRLEAFRAGWHSPIPKPYIAPLGLKLTNGVPNRLFVVWGEPNIRYTVQFSPNLTQWADLPIPADEGQAFITTPSGQSGFYRTVLRP